MPGPNPELKITIDADIRRFNAGIQQVQNEIKQFVNQTEGSRTALQGMAAQGVKAFNTQQNALYRLTNNIKNLERRVKQANITDARRAELLKNLNLQERYLTNALSKRAINTAQLGKINREANKKLQDVNRTLKDVEEKSKNEGINRLRNQLTDLSKSAQIALGPLSGVAARITAFSSLAGSAQVGIATVAASIIAVGGAVAKGFNEARNFEQQLIAVQKTTGLSNSALKELGRTFLDLSNNTGIVAVEIATIGQAAGQLGISGVKNIAAFTEVVAKLTKTTNLTAEEAARALARILTVSEESPQEVRKLGSAITALGNNFAASEKEIVHVTNEVARAIAIFGVASEESAAFATALRASGVRAESAGSAIGRLFLALSRVTDSGGEAVRSLEALTNMSAGEFKKAFEDDASEAVKRFVIGLNTISDDPEKVAKVLESIGIAGVDSSKALLPLIKNINTLVDTLDVAARDVASGSNAIENELNNALRGTNAQLDILIARINNAFLIFGESFLPIVNSVLSAINDLGNASTYLAQTLAGVTAGLGSFLLVAGGLKILQILLRNIGLIITALRTLTGAAIGASAALASFSAAAIPLIGGIAAITAAIYAFNKAGEDAAVSTNKLAEATNKLTEASSAQEKIQILVGTRKSLEEDATAMEERMEMLRNTIQKLSEQKGRGSIAAQFKIADAKKELKTLEEAYADLQEKILAVIDSILQFGAEAKRTRKDAETLTDVLGTAGESALKRFQKLNEELEVGRKKIAAYVMGGRENLNIVEAELDARKKVSEIFGTVARGSEQERRIARRIGEELGVQLKTRQDLVAWLNKQYEEERKIDALLKTAKQVDKMKEQTSALKVQNNLFGQQEDKVKILSNLEKTRTMLIEAGVDPNHKIFKLLENQAMKYLEQLQTAKSLQAADNARLETLEEIAEIQQTQARIRGLRAGISGGRSDAELEAEALEKVRQAREKYRTKGGFNDYEERRIQELRALGIEADNLYEAELKLLELRRKQSGAEEIAQAVKNSKDELRILERKRRFVIATNDQRAVELELQRLRNIARETGAAFDEKAHRARLQQIADENFAYEQQRKLVDTIFDQVGKGLASSIRESENLREIWKRIGDTLLDALIQLLVIEPLIRSIRNSLSESSSFGSSSSGGGGIFGSILGIAGTAVGAYFGGPGGAAVGGAAAQNFGNSAGVDNYTAKGGMFRGGSLMKFQAGGIVGGPAMFPMSGGRTGLMGEAGPEAVMPLERGADGKLGVKTSGGGNNKENGVTIYLDLRGSNGDKSIEEAVQRGITQAAPFLINSSVQKVRDERRRDPRFFGVSNGA